MAQLVLQFNKKAIKLANKHHFYSQSSRAAAMNILWLCRLMERDRLRRGGYFIARFTGFLAIKLVSAV